MATKKTTTKKSAKHKKFDLSIEKKEQIPEIVNALQNLELDHGWQLLRQIFEGNIAVLETSILKKIDPDSGKALSEEECDRQRDKLSYLEELINKPREIIEKLTQGQPETPEYDPYDKTPRVRVIGRKAP